MMYVLFKINKKSYCYFALERIIWNEGRGF